MSTGSHDRAVGRAVARTSRSPGRRRPRTPRRRRAARRRRAPGRRAGRSSCCGGLATAMRARPRPPGPAPRSSPRWTGSSARPPGTYRPTRRTGTQRSVTVPPGTTWVVTSVRRWSACTSRTRSIATSSAARTAGSRLVERRASASAGRPAGRSGRRRRTARSPPDRGARRARGRRRRSARPRRPRPRRRPRRGAAGPAAPPGPGARPADRGASARRESTTRRVRPAVVHGRDRPSRRDRCTRAAEPASDEPGPTLAA